MFRRSYNLFVRSHKVIQVSYFDQCLPHYLRGCLKRHIAVRGCSCIVRICNHKTKETCIELQVFQSQQCETEKFEVVENFPPVIL